MSRSQQLLPLWASGQGHLVKLYKSQYKNPLWTGIVSLLGSQPTYHSTLISCHSLYTGEGKISPVFILIKFIIIIFNLYSTFQFPKHTFLYNNASTYPHFAEETRVSEVNCPRSFME